MHLFPLILRRLVRAGRLEVFGPHGFHEVMERLGVPGPHVVLRVRSWRIDLRMMKNSSLGLAEAYLDELWALDRGTVSDFPPADLVARWGR